MGKFGDLPVEIVSDIISRLPIESVLECKMVSKPWKNLISHPSFSQLHLDRLNDSDSDSGGRLAFLYMNSRLHYTEYDEISGSCIRTSRDNFTLPDIITGYYVLGSVNGLICFNACYGDDWANYQPAYILNPLTREYVMLPRLERKVKVQCGFGYIPSTNVYKVVRIYELPDKREQVEVYTLGSGNGWRDVGKLDESIGSYKLPGVFANGAVHWLHNEQSVVAFDLADEKFRQFPSPPFSPQYGNRLSVGVLGDSLCATYGKENRFFYPINSNYDMSIYTFDIWLLKKNEDNDGSSWIKQFNNFVGYEPFAFTNSGGLLCYGGDRTNIYHYDPKASSSQLLINCGHLNLEVVLHKNTLVGLKALGEIDARIMECGERTRSSEEMESADSD